MARKINNKGRRLFMLLTLMAGIFTTIALIFTSANKVHAEGTNKVFFSNTVIETEDSLIIAEIVAQGTSGDNVTVAYHTEGVTAIQGIDYNGVNNIINMKIDSNGEARYKISIKCLNDVNSREKLRTYSVADDNTVTNYGRYFNIKIDYVKNAEIEENKDVCKCYLPYNYKTQVVVGDQVSDEVAYIKDYETMMTKYHKGDNDISGKETWKTWNEGVSFDNDTTRNWTNAYINQGLAQAYSTYMIKNIDDDKVQSYSNIYLLNGNKEMMTRYTRSRDCPGLGLYLEIEPCVGDDGTKLNGDAMNYIVAGKNPYKEQGELVDREEHKVVAQTKRIYWQQNEKTWFANKGAYVNSTFFKNPPYNGILDTGLAIFNNNKSWDREVHDIYLFLTLVDDTTPTVVGEYIDDSTYSIDGKLKFYVRFSEPVFRANNKDLSVWINNSSNPKWATYVTGEYTDTLVYEIGGNDVPTTNITSVTYQLPNDDIGDMSYNMDKYNKVRNNRLPLDVTSKDRQMNFINGTINLVKPVASADPSNSKNKENNIYNILLSINNNGEVDLTSGTIYYEWSNESYETKDIDINDPANYKKFHTFTPEETGSFSITLVKNLEEGIDNGTWYLNVLAVSDYGLKHTKTFGAYILDGDPPEVLAKEGVSGLQTKELILEVTNKANGDDKIDEVTLLTTYLDKDGNTITTPRLIIDNGLKAEDYNTLINISEEDGKTIYKFNSDISETALRPDTFMKEIMGERERLEVTYQFTVLDIAGNTASTIPFKTVYDTRTLFNVKDLDVSANYIEIDESAQGLDIPYKVYNIKTATDEDYIKIELDDDVDSDIIADLAGYTEEGDVLFSVDVDGKTISATPGITYIEVKGLGVGFHEIIPKIKGMAPGTDTYYDLVAKTIGFYLTNDLDDKTENRDKADGDLVLSNKVIQLTDSRYYYLDSVGSVVQSHSYGATFDEEKNRYDGGSSSPAFSSTNEAKKYVKYMEYQDLYLVRISANMASLLNSGTGSTTYVKASGETQVAQEGQLWIRYKKSNWNPSSTPYGWAFYYYGSSSGTESINTNNLSANLNNAINSVVNTITSEGETIYLVTEDTTNQRTGAPYLAEGQMHVKEEKATVSKAGSNFIVKPSYPGDNKLFNNKVKVNNVEYSLATNLEVTVTKSTTIYYKFNGEGNWVRLNISDGDNLSKIIPTSGYYIFREYGNGGVSQYGIYIDNELPVLKVDIDGTEQNLNDEIVRFSGNKFTLKSLTDVDQFAYVAIMSYPTKNLPKVLYKEDIPSGENDGYQLTSGNYYIQVGDRSGNVVMYTVLLSSSTLDVTAVENESKTGIVVKVNNRDENEIYAYEIYLNEELLTTEFATYKFLRDAGVYRIHVVDIYGNDVEIVVEHAFQTPKINWYYQNDNDGYSKYDEENIVRMTIVKDTSSPRASFVYTSRLLKIQFENEYGNSEIKYEILDITKDDYTYSQTNMTITIQKLASFRIRVWYEQFPENDYLYVINIDNEAPTIEGRFLGASYTLEVKMDASGRVIKTASFDQIDFDKYNNGDEITLDTLNYIPANTSEISFTNGSVISGSRIVLKVGDPSGIKSYSVTRNGQPVEVAMSSDNELKLNNYGVYIVTVDDLLGNREVFRFTNTNDSIANSSIDDVAIQNQGEGYGHDNLSIKTLFAGETKILVNTGTKTITYVFNFDGTTLTYGQYYCVVIEKDDEGQIVQIKDAEYREKSGFAIDVTADNVREGYWYTVLPTPDYVISVMFENKLPIYKVECVDTQIDAEISLIVGNCVYPSRAKATLSKEQPLVGLLTNGVPVEIVEDSKYIYVSKNLTIDPNVNENITKIEVGFSDSPEVNNLEVIYDKGFIREFVGTEYGFYRIVVTNKFNNITEYLVVKIDSFKSVVYATYIDGTTREFLKNTTIYSNSVIELNVFSDTVSFELDGEYYAGYYESGVTKLTLDKKGHYSVKVVSSNGIFEDFSLVIGNDYNFEFDESWITGYNDNALLRDQGYTNTILSVELADGVEYIEYSIGDGDPTVLYDNISETKVIDLNKLKNSIGNDGVGVYTIRFTNIYGDVVSKTIHYSNIASLNLSRKTLSSGSVFTDYDLEYAVEHNFYSNYVLRFSTNSKNYEFKIDGSVISLEEPKTLEFSNSSGNGSFGYHISYLDEYGNFIEFEAELYRADVMIDTSAMKEITVDKELYTKDNIKITFADNLTATVSVNGKEAIDYTSGYTYYKDGKYQFTVEDIAGNRTVYTINHKSVNSYTLINQSTGQNVIIGGVVNNSNVTFSATDDSKITDVFKNGVKVSDYNSTSFSTTGHWEILIEDSIGNTTYAGFYVINNPLVSFIYSAPFDYTITEVWYTNQAGQRKLLELKGGKVELNENGDYALVVTAKESTSTFNFSVTIDDSLPTAKLKGVENEGVTAKNVSLTGLKKGDTVEVYKSGVLYSTTNVTLSETPPEITEGGDYRIVITNAAGAQVEYTFTRKQIANSATSIFIIITCLVAIAGISIGLIYHTRLKTDQ